MAKATPMERAVDLAHVAPEPYASALRELCQYTQQIRTDRDEALSALRSFKRASNDFVEWHPRYQSAIETARAVLAKDGDHHGT